MKRINIFINLLIATITALILIDLLFMNGVKTIELLEKARFSGLILTFPLIVIGMILYNLWNPNEE